MVTPCLETKLAFIVSDAERRYYPWWPFNRAKYYNSNRDIAGHMLPTRRISRAKTVSRHMRRYAPMQTQGVFEVVEFELADRKSGSNRGSESRAIHCYCTRARISPWRTSLVAHPRAGFEFDGFFRSAERWQYVCRARAG